MKVVNVLDFRIDLFRDDAEIAAGLTVGQWEKGEMGSWLKDNNVEISWHKEIDHACFEYRCCVIAKFTPELYTFWRLKF